MVPSNVRQPTPEMIHQQLKLLVEHPVLRSSKRLIAFLQYVVSQSLSGTADQLKERTIGVEVFNRDPDYDTSSDHIVRTAASELRKRLGLYYGDESHQSQLRIEIPSGSYIPQFTLPEPSISSEVNQPQRGDAPSRDAVFPTEAAEQKRNRRWIWSVAVLILIAVLGTAAIVLTRSTPNPRSQLWNPIIRTSDPVLLVIGRVPKGPPLRSAEGSSDSMPRLQESEPGFPTIDVADAIAMTRIASFLAIEGKTTIIRQENASSFSDLRESPAVLIGAFNNEWSLQLTRQLRFSFALDPDRQLIYIRDRQNPTSRTWAVAAAVRVESQTRTSNEKPTPDYALISRIVDSETGKAVFVLSGLYAFGTQAAGEFITDPQLDNLTASVPLTDWKRNLQIVLETNVTEGIPGRPRIVAYSIE